MANQRLKKAKNKISRENGECNGRKAKNKMCKRKRSNKKRTTAAKIKIEWKKKKVEEKEAGKAIRKSNLANKKKRRRCDCAMVVKC